MTLKIKKIILLFVVCASFGYTQKSIGDSLIALLSKVNHDTARCKILTALVENEFDEKIWEIYNDSLFELANRNLKIANTKQLKGAFTLFYTHAISNRAFLMLEYGNITKALEYYYEILSIYERLGAKNEIAITLNNIAYIYKGQGEIDKAMQVVKKALKIQEETGNEKGIAESLNNIGNLYQIKQDTKIALDYFNKSLGMNTKINDSYGISKCLANISSMYDKLGNKDKALECLKKALMLREEIGDKEGVSSVLSYMAKILFDQGHLDEALMHGNRSYQIANELHYVDNLRHSSAILYKIHQKMNNPAEALKMYELFIAMRDSVMNETTRKATYKKDLQINYEKKAAADSVRVEEEKKIVQIELKQERTKNFALYGGIALIGLFSAFMFNRFKVTQKQNVLIHEQKAELQKQKEIVEGHQKETLDSIHYAKRIQTALIANSNFIDQHIPNNFIYFNPKDIVSGDFYWAAEHNHKFYLAICDSTGHGVPGAFMSLLNMGFLSEAIKEKNIEKPNDIFDYVRERLINAISSEGQKDGMDGILLCLDKKTNSLEYCAANNEPILITDGTIVELAKDKMPVGQGERKEKFTLHKLQLKPGDHLYLYTDGYADQFGGPKGKKFMYNRLNELLLSLKDIPLADQKFILEKTLSDWKMGIEQIDDVLIAGIKIEKII